MTIVAPSMYEVLAALRLDDPDENASDLEKEAAGMQEEILYPLLNMATERAKRVAPDAPRDVATAAILQAVGWLFQYSGGADYSANWWQRSGAATTLKPYVRRRGGLIG